MFKIQSDVIRELAEKQSCLFVGRCADYILRDHLRCVNIFVSASNEARIERLMHIHQISTEAAEELMEKADKKRSAYYNYYRDVYKRQTDITLQIKPGNEVKTFKTNAEGKATIEVDMTTPDVYKRQM